MNGTSRPNCDTTAEELRIINLIPQHNVSVDQHVTRDRNFGSRTVTTVQDAMIDLLQMLIV